MIKLFNDRIDRKIKIKIFSLTKKYTRQLISLYFSFYNWREITKVKTITEGILNELGIL